MDSNPGGLRTDYLALMAAAEASYRRAVEIRPDYAEAHGNLGNLLKVQGRFLEAEASYRRALELNGELAEVHFGLGSILVDSDRPSEAEDCYRRALAIKPEDAEGLYNLGVCLQKQGRAKEAEGSFRQALSIKADFAEAHHALGGILQEAGRLEEALASYRLFLRAKGDWKEALRRLTSPLVSTGGLELGPCCSAAGTGGAQSRGPLSLGPGAKRLRIVLIYPPPWQIPSPGEAALPSVFAPPKNPKDRNLDGDFQTIPYGVLMLAAQAKRAGHTVSVCNLSTSAWKDVVSLIAESDADVFGISAFTANRRGMGAVAALIREKHPRAHITVGGPFVTALPADTLRHYQDIDTAVIGEGETTFLELLDCLVSGRPAVGIPGTAWRDGEGVVIGPARQRITDLDALASLFDYFVSPMVITSRGCPSKCTYCGSFTTWGKRLHFHSVGVCLDIFQKALARLPMAFIAIKDDTFTANRSRAMAICDEIIERKLNFIWSCDSRVDSLDDELLCKMRRAGCQMISLGVESGSPKILETIHKRASTDMVLEVTRAAKKYGFHVRYYMMLCNRGETPETVQESVDLVRAGRPDSYLFSYLAFYPGTEEWTILSEQEGLKSDVFFNNDFKELSVAINRYDDAQDVLLQTICDIGTFSGFEYALEEREAIAARLPDVSATYVELANACFRAGRLDEAESALDRAELLAFPIMDILLNQRACIALARGDVSKALALLAASCKSHPTHVAVKNLNNLRNWANADAENRGEAPVLDDSVLALNFLGDWETAGTTC